MDMSEDLYAKGPGVTWKQAAQRLRQQAEENRVAVDEALDRYGKLRDQQRIYQLALDCFEDEGRPPADEVSKSGQEDDPERSK